MPKKETQQQKTSTKPTKPKGHPKGPCSPSMTKRDKEVGISERTLLELNQTIRSIQKAETWQTVTVKAAKSLMDKLIARCTPELVQLYTATFDAVSDSSSAQKDLKILEDLTTAKLQAQKLHVLMTCLHATAGRAGDESTTGEALLAAVEDATGSGVLEKACGFYLEMALDRELLAAFNKQDFARYMDLLDLHADKVSGNVSLRKLEGSMPNDELATLHENNITKGLVDLLRQPEAYADVRAGLAKLRHTQIAGEANEGSITSELKLLMSIANPWDINPSDEELLEAKTKLEKGATMKVHKCLTLFPTGVMLMEVAAMAITKRRTGQECEVKLKDMDHLMDGPLSA